MTSFAATSLRMNAGVILWAAHFTVIYFSTALACARGQPRAVPWIIGIATLIGLALVGVVIARAWPRRSDFEAWFTAAVAGFAAIAMFWEALPVLIIPACR